MKQLIQLIFILPVLLFISGCDRKSCDETQCNYRQQCIQGNCYCLNGYEGSACETEAYVKYVRSYDVTESCENGSPTFSQYSTTIIQDQTYINRLIVTNFLNSGTLTLLITTDGNNRGNSVSIPYQQAGAIYIEGNGLYNESNRTLILNVNYTYGSESKSCTHTFYPN